MASSSEKSKLNLYCEDYDSDFEYDAEAADKRKARNDLIESPVKHKNFKPNKQEFHEECSKELGKFRRQAFLALDAYTRHKKLINEYVLCYQGATEKFRRKSDNCKTDFDVITENHKFLWEDDDEVNTWGQQLAKRYYDRLFKEYCLCDLSRYKEKKIGMRWRTEKELIVGKGQFFCGNVKCDQNNELDTWEVLFGYVEHGSKKSALVKLRLCPRCSEKLHYGYKGKAALKRKHSKNKLDNQKSESTSKDVETVSESKDLTKDESQVAVWKQPIKEDAEPSKEELFEEFLEDLFL